MFDRFRTLPQERQLGLAGLLMLVLAIVMIAAWLELREPFQPLFTNLKSTDAATIVEELDHKKATYRLADGGTTILVPADRVDATRLELMNGNLALKGTVGFELFNKSDMGLTDFAQRINYQRALQGELERTIMALDSVEESRVHLSLGEDRIFREDRVAPKASVTIRMRAGASLGLQSAAGIQRLVAASVPQLEPMDVVILDETGRVISATAVAQAPPLPAEMAEQSAIGAYYEARVREALQHAYLADKVRVQVRAGLAQKSGADGRGEGDWNPQARDFPLQVTLDVAASLDGAARQDIQGIAAGAVGFDASRGDAIGFGPIASPVAPAVLPDIVAHAVDHDGPASDKTRARDEAMPTLTLAAAAAAVALLVAAILMAGRLRQSRPLSADERARIATRLRGLLQEDGLDGALS